MNLKKLQKQAFEISSPDFLRAVESRNYDEMTDCYNEMMRYDDFGASDEAGPKGDVPKNVRPQTVHGGR